LKPTLAALRAHGDQPALEGCAPSVSYRQLSIRAEAVADALATMGVNPGDRVALLSVGRGHDEAVGLLGIIISGAVAIPLDASAPHQRNAHLLESCCALVHDSAATGAARRHTDMARLDLDEEGFVLASIGSALTDLEPTPELAFVLHTSGSTGTPKPVAMLWDGIDAFTRWMSELTRLAPGRRVLRVAELCFDLAIFDHLASFEHGATLCTMNRRDGTTSRNLASRVAALQPNVIYAVPALLTMLVDGGVKPASVDTLCFAGEVYPPAALQRLAQWAPEARLFNLFGPTETNVCTYWEVDRSRLDGESEIPIGRACPYASCRLVSDNGDPIDGVGTGELVVSGPTALGGEVATRDRVERRDDGMLYFRGRLDRMVKIAGRRVDPGEVEAALRAHPAVHEAAVTSGVQSRIGRRLVAYVTTTTPCERSLLRKYLAERLPPYMVPDDVKQLDGMPRTSTGKIDYTALD
jgi:acyl-coenzyme A synthetase/AMP-(fatty) acid ligase